MKELCSERGVTLAEVIIYIAGSLFLFAGLNALLTLTLHSWHDSSHQTEAQQTARMALDSMVRELRQAVSLEYDEGNCHQIVYVEPVEGSKVCFYESSGFLYRRKNSLAPQPVAGAAKYHKVKDVTFTLSHDSQAVDIELTVLWHDWNGAERTERLKTTVYCVNCPPKNEST